jgi:hypothetical protein
MTPDIGADTPHPPFGAPPTRGEAKVQFGFVLPNWGDFSREGEVGTARPAHRLSPGV